MPPRKPVQITGTVAPSLSDDEVSAAYENGKIAASLKGKPLATSPENIGFIAVKFALHDGSGATGLWDYFSARALATLIGSVDKIGPDLFAVAGRRQSAEQRGMVLELVGRA